MKRIVTIFVFGESGVGKSSFGNIIIKKKDAFKVGSSCHSMTLETIAIGNEINNEIIYFIDYPGHSTSTGQDKKYLKQMIEYIHKWDKGINAFFIVLNIQEPRFTEETQKMIKLMNYFFNDPTMWERTGIIFTRCYADAYNAEEATFEYGPEITKFIKSLNNCENLEIDMPCFFVDSEEYETDENTQREYQKILDFAHNFEPVLTNNFREINPDYMMVEYEIIKKKKVGEDLNNIEGSDIRRIRKIYYEDQRVAKYTNWKEEISYGEAETIRSWQEEQIEEKQILQRQHIKTDINKEGNITTKRFHYEDQERYQITHADNKISFSPPLTIRSWTEEQIEEEEILYDQQVQIERIGNGRNCQKIIYYENQKRLKITSPSGDITYSTPITLMRYPKVINSIVKNDEKVEVISENKYELTHVVNKDGGWERFGKGLLCVITLTAVDLGPDLRVVHDGWKIVTRYGKYQREVIIDPDGNEIQNDWICVNEWTEEKTINN